MARGGKLSSGYVNRRSRPYFFRKCKMSSLTNIDSLPDELVFEILLHLPAEDIYEGARLVSRKWYNMISSPNFVHKHLNNSIPRVVIQISSSRGHRILATASQNRIEMIDYKNEFFGTGNGCSCNGLILGFDVTKDALYVANPATKKHFALPPSFKTSFNLGIIAYSAASMEYKVVHSYLCRDHNPAVHRCAILTAGVDKSWRHLNIEHLSLPSRFLLHSTPLTTEGFMHWTGKKYTHVLSLNVGTEIITETPVPDCYIERFKVYLSSGTALNLLVRCSDFLWAVLELKQETGEWTKVIEIDLEPRKGEIERLVRGSRRRYLLIPAGWVIYKEVLVIHVFSETNVFLLYNIHTQEIIDFFELDEMYVSFDFYLYRSSLVWLDGC